MRKFVTILVLLLNVTVWAQKSNTKTPAASVSAEMNAETFSGLKLRSIGPAFLSGRIQDIAIHPQDESIWYIAAGSGGAFDANQTAASRIVGQNNSKFIHIRLTNVTASSEAYVVYA